MHTNLLPLNKLSELLLKVYVKCWQRPWVLVMVALGMWICEPEAELQPWLASSAMATACEQ